MQVEPLSKHTESEALRSWYLARLRRLAHELESPVSPSGLMQADQRLISEITKAAREQTENGSSADTDKAAPLGTTNNKGPWAKILRIKLSGAFLLVFSSFISILALIQYLTQAASSSAQEALPNLFFFCWGSLLCTLICLFQFWLLSTLSLSPEAEKDQPETLKEADLAKQIRQMQEAENLTFEFSPQLLFTLSKELQILICNQTFLNFFQLAFNEVKQKNFSELAANNQRQQLQSSFANGMADLSPIEQELMVFCNRGARKFILIHAEWSKSNQCYFCQADDISAAKELDEIKQRFVSMISHDLRAPLQSMELAVDLFASGRFGELGEPAAIKLNTVQKNIHRLIKLCSDLLDLDMMQVGQLQIKAKKSSSKSLLQASCQAVSDLAASKELKIETRLEKEYVYCDEERMIQVLINLLSNAIKFSPANSTVSLHVREARDYDEIIVSDQGPGLDKSLSAEIFNPYRQADGKQTEKGFGLGLAISKAIVELHGGKIGFSSEPGKGTSFWIRIPAN